MINKELKKQINDYVQNAKAEYKAKQKFLSSKTDFSFLETLIQKCNDNPNLRINVTLRDGTTLALRCYKENQSRKDLINGLEEYKY